MKAARAHAGDEMLVAVAGCVAQAEGQEILTRARNKLMLEYMLIRPKDREMLNPEWAEALQYIVLDEAHTYEGRRGADVAMLMRRIKRRMKGRGRVRCIATSATLPDR